MACFTEQDMRTYMTDLGHTAMVTDVSKNRELHFLQQLRSELKSNGGVTLLTQYAPLCTLMKRADNMQSATQKELVDTVILAVKTAYDEVHGVKDKLGELSDSKSKYFQQVIGIALWIAYTLLEEFNYFSSVSHQISGDTKKPRGKSSFTPVPGDNKPFEFWAKGKQTLLETLKRLLELNLMPIWNGNMNLVNKKNFYELILHSLTNCIKYGSRDINMMYDVLLDIFAHFIANLDLEDQLIHELMFNIVQSDEMARAVGKILIGLREDKNLPNVIKKSIMRAVQLVNSQEYQDSIEKGFSVFLYDIGSHFPEEIKANCLPYILPFTDSHVISVRNAVLAILVEILQIQKEEIDSKKSCEDEELVLRSKLYGFVEDFICDVNSAIRSKALSYLTKALDSNGLMIDEVLKITKEVNERLLDSAVTTRKNAFNFFSSLMNKEVSLAKFTPSELYEAIIKKRREFLEERIQFIPPHREDTKIKICINEFSHHISAGYIKKAISSRPLPAAMSSAEKAIAHIDKLIHERKIWDACECFYRATIEFANEDVFRNFHDNHTYDFYRAYIGNELGLDLSKLKTDAKEDLDTSISETLESEVSENIREVLHHWHVLGILSEIIANEVIPNVLILLEKGTATDQIEALAFFGKLSLYGYTLTPAMEVQILENVRSVSKSISGSILEPFSLIYLKGEDAEMPFGFVKTLIELCDRLGPQGRDHISFLIEDMVSVKKFHVNELKVLWDIITLRVPAMGEKESKIAMYILLVCAKANRGFVQSLYQPLMEVALGPRGLEDMEFVYLALLIISEYIGQESKAKDTGLQAVRLPGDSLIFHKIFDIIKHCLHPDTRDLVSNSHFRAVIELGISIIYNFSLVPDTMITKIVEQAYSWFFEKTAADCKAAEEAGKGTFDFQMEEKEILRVMILGGAITSHHSSYHICTILEEVKKRKTLRHIDGIQNTPTKRRLRRSFVENSRRKSMGTSRLDFSELEESALKAGNDELEQIVGQIGFDKEIDVLRNYMEVLLDDGVISFYWKFVQHICRRFKKIQSSCLRIATLHLFGQCMLVGSKAVTTGMELFIKIWQVIQNPDEKGEMITMAILLNYSYPNMMERCNSLILSDLTSEHKNVRLMVLDCVIFLTQSDILKLRDILADTVLCLADESEEIREVTKNFLRECQEKDTMLHTSIPDLIFRTSSNVNVPKPKFQEIMRALLGPFKKTVELSGIVDKLVDRFGMIGLADESAEDNAFCLSLLPYGERTFKIIVDRVSIYEKYMNNEVIYDAFVMIVESAKENCKIEGKKGGIEKIEKFQERLNVAKEKYTHSSGTLEKVRF